LVFLNACEGARGSPRASFTSVASSLVLVGIPAVVAMQFRITDRAAIQFASAFYLSLVDNYPVDASVAEGRKAIALETNYDTVEWVTPVLYMRAPNGVIFELPPSDLALNQRKQALSKEEEQLDNLFQQGMSYLDNKQLHQALIVFEQIRSISPTYKNINVREIIAYLRAEIVGRQRGVPERSPHEETQQVGDERFKDTWQRIRQSVGSWAQGLGRKESGPSAASEAVDWNSVIARAVDTIGKRLKQPLRVCSWEVVEKKEQINLILEGSGWRKFKAVVNNEGNVLQLTPEKGGGLEWPGPWRPQVPRVQTRYFQCEECGRRLETTLDEKGQAKVKCKNCHAHYIVFEDKHARVDVRCPVCGMINVVPFDFVKRKLPPTINCKLCKNPMRLVLK
jgi:transcription elongation factor Elf1